MSDKKQQLNEFEKLKLDPYTHAILQKMGVETFDSFTEEQKEKLVESISACTPLQKHPVDIRGVISFFFVRYYYVILAGRDRRKKVRRIEIDRRHQTRKAASFFSKGFFITYVLLILLVVLFIVAYKLKSMAGINLFEDKHLHDFFN